MSAETPTPIHRAHASHEDLARFTSESLVAELEKRGQGAAPLGGASNAAILAEMRERCLFDDEGLIVDPFFDLREASARFRRGETADALHYLERALPADFAGLAQLAAITPRAAA